MEKSKYPQPYLEKYTDRASRHECPECHSPHSFALYLKGDTHEVIDKTVGRCNHESACGYHYPPKEFFNNHPEKRTRTVPLPQSQSMPVVTNKEPDTIPFGYVTWTASYCSAFVSFLYNLFDVNQLESPTINRLVDDYALGATKNGEIIYWQIDVNGKVRTGKVMKYDEETGKRIKDTSGINWIHAMMKKKQWLPNDFNMIQCLFGEHLLKMHLNKVVALVEAEKTALIAAAIYPDYIWLATGSKSQLSMEKLKVLKNRTVMMFPDVDGHEYWERKAGEMQEAGCNVIVSDLLELDATEEERQNKIDIADWLIRQYLDKATKEENQIPKEERIKHAMNNKPTLQSLIDAFDIKTS